MSFYLYVILLSREAALWELLGGGEDERAGEAAEGFANFRLL